MTWMILALVFHFIFSLFICVFTIIALIIEDRTNIKSHGKMCNNINEYLSNILISIIPIFNIVLLFIVAQELFELYLKDKLNKLLFNLLKTGIKE